MLRHLSAAGFRASLGLLSDLDKALDGDAEWLFLGTVWIWGREAHGLCRFISLGENVFT